MPAIRLTCAAVFPLASWNALPFRSELFFDALDIQCSMNSFEINMGYYSISKARIENVCITLPGRRRREKERKIKWKRQQLQMPRLYTALEKKKIIVSFAVTVTQNFPDVHIWKCHKMSWHKLCILFSAERVNNNKTASGVYS